jgi:hypothetical protein
MIIISSSSYILLRWWSSQKEGKRKRDKKRTIAATQTCLDFMGGWKKQQETFSSDFPSWMNPNDVEVERRGGCNNRNPNFGTLSRVPDPASSTDARWVNGQWSLRRERETREAGDQKHGDPYLTHLHLMHDLQQELEFSSSARIHQRCRLVCCMLQQQYQDLVSFFRTLDQVLSLFFFFFKYVVVSNPFLPHWICKQAGERERDWKHKRMVQFSWETLKTAASIMLPSVFSSAFHTYNPAEEEEEEEEEAEGEGIVVRWS